MIKLILIIFCSFIFSTNISGYELAKMIDEKKQPQSSKSQITMKLIDLDKGREKIKEMYSISKDDGNKMLMFFKTPKRDKGVGFLKIEALDTDKLSLFIPFKASEVTSISEAGLFSSQVNNQLNSAVNLTKNNVSNSFYKNRKNLVSSDQTTSALGNFDLSESTIKCYPGQDASFFGANASSSLQNNLRSIRHWALP